MSVYVDASALAKLVIREAESDALRRYLELRTDRASSRLAAIEVPRACWRAGFDAEDVARRIKGMTLIELDVRVSRIAATLSPATLRSSDAAHLATALQMGEDLEAFVTYDRRLAEAARAAGLTVVAPE